MKKRAFILLLCFFFITSTFTFANTEMHAVLDEVEGEVYITRSGGKVELAAQAGMKIFQGDTIRTGKNSSAKLNFGDGDETTIGQYGKVTISELTASDEEEDVEGLVFMSKYSKKKVTVNQRSGSLWSKVKNVGTAGNRHKVRTSTAIMGVRGTLFYTEYHPTDDYLSLYGFDGAIEFSYRSPEEKIEKQLELIQSGEGITSESLKKEPLLFQEIFNRIEASIAKEIVTDTTAVAQEKLEEARQKLTELQETSDETEVTEALLAAAKAEAQAKIAKNVIHALRTSPVSSEVEQRLGRNLAQELDRVNELLEQAQNTREEVKEIAEEYDIPDEVIDEGQTIVDRIPDIPETPAPAPPSSGGGSSPPSDPVSQITSITLGEVSPLQIGDKKQIPISVQPSSVPINNIPLIWEVVEGDAVQVKNGEVSAVELGNAIVKVKVEGRDLEAETSVLVNRGYHFVEESYELDLDWIVPTDIGDIDSYKIYHSNSKVSNLDQATLINHLLKEPIFFDDEFHNCRIDVEDILKGNNYFYVVALNENQEELHRIEFHIPLPCTVCENKIFGIKPVLMENIEGNGIKYEIPSGASPLNFRVLGLPYADEVQKMVFKDSSGNVIHETVIIDEGYEFILNLRNVAKIEMHFKDNPDNIENYYNLLTLNGDAIDYISSPEVYIEVIEENTIDVVIQLKGVTNYENLIITANDLFKLYDELPNGSIIIGGLNGNTEYNIKCYIETEDGQFFVVEKTIKTKD